MNGITRCAEFCHQLALQIITKSFTTSSRVPFPQIGTKPDKRFASDNGIPAPGNVAEMNRNPFLAGPGSSADVDVWQSGVQARTQARCVPQLYDVDLPHARHD